MPRKPEPEEPAKANRLTLAQLAAHDDVSTDAMVDQAYYWSRIRKNCNKHFPVRGIREDDVPQILLHQVIVAKDAVKAEQMLLKLPGLKRYLSSLRTGQEKEHFLRHLRKYINMYLPDSPFEVSTTNRYTITTQEAAVTARKRVKQGETIKYLSGTLVPLTLEESEDLDLTQRNFSIVVSSRKKTSSIFLGPARFANHDCDANGRLVTRGSEGMEVIAVKNIEVGDEITVTYGEDYFGPNNVECLCHSCELAGRNGWASGAALGNIRSRTSTPALGTPGEPYSFRRKRKYQVDTSSESSPAPSTTPKKLKMSLKTSALGQVLTVAATSVSQSAEQPQMESTGIARATARIVEPEAGLGISTPLGMSDFSRRLNQPLQRSSMLSHEIPSLYSPATEASIGEKPFSTFPDAEQPPKKRRLIDLMTMPSSTSHTFSAELSKSVPARSSSSEDSGSESHAPTQSTDATDVSEDRVTIKTEFNESSRSKSDDDTIVLNVVNKGSKELLQKLDPPASRSTNISLSTEVSESRVLEGSTTPIPHTTASLKIVHSAKITTPKDDILPSIEQSSTIAKVSATQTSDTIRVPGDYVLTRKLLAQSFDRWVQCQTCKGNFVQPNGYQTRRECPRCERHSMLYGLGWPHTEPDPRRSALGRGKNAPLVQTGRKGRSGKGTWVEGGTDENGRVMDHRTVHRFLYPEEEREIKRRALLYEAERGSANGTETPDPATVGGAGSESQGRETSSPGEDGKRRSRRFVRGGRITM